MQLFVENIIVYNIRLDKFLHFAEFDYKLSPIFLFALAQQAKHVGMEDNDISFLFL